MRMRFITTDRALCHKVESVMTAIKDHDKRIGAVSIAGITFRAAKTGEVRADVERSPLRRTPEDHEESGKKSGNVILARGISTWWACQGATADQVSADGALSLEMKRIQ